MSQLINRALSALIVIAYLIAAYFGGGAEAVIRSSLYLILPLACIWYGEELGAYTGIMRGQSIETESPSCLVALMGWVLLLLPLVVLLTRSLW